jgi:hypothetical protein
MLRIKAKDFADLIKIGLGIIVFHVILSGNNVYG